MMVILQRHTCFHKHPSGGLAPCLHVKLARTTLALTMRDVSQEVKVSKSSENRRYNPDVIPDVSVARGDAGVGVEVLTTCTDLLSLLI